jgi:hypothetical protein
MDLLILSCAVHIIVNLITPIFSSAQAIAKRPLQAAHRLGSRVSDPSVAVHYARSSAGGSDCTSWLDSLACTTGVPVASAGRAGAPVPSIFLAV